MEVNMMSWNTGLYEYGNIKNKKVKNGYLQLRSAIDYIKSFLEKNNSIVVLQEIPFMYKIGMKWLEHPYFSEITAAFPKEKFSILFNIYNPYQKLMTFVIAKKELIEKLNDNQNLNSFVSFYIKPYDIPVVGVHSDNAYEMLTYLNKISFRPKILIGDFNSGNYLKDDQEKDRAIKSNRINYLFVSEGYIDMCQGKYTLAYYKTQIDHILVENRNSFLERLTYENATVDYQFKCSDHYPICWKFEISEM